MPFYEGGVLTMGLAVNKGTSVQRRQKAPAPYLV